MFICTCKPRKCVRTVRLNWAIAQLFETEVNLDIFPWACQDFEDQHYLLVTGVSKPPRLNTNLCSDLSLICLWWLEAQHDRFNYLKTDGVLELAKVNQDELIVDV